MPLARLFSLPVVLFHPHPWAGSKVLAPPLGPDSNHSSKSVWLPLLKKNTPFYFENKVVFFYCQGQPGMKTNSVHFLAELLDAFELEWAEGVFKSVKALG